MQEGILIKGYGGFYYVKAGETLWECSLRGKFRKLKQNFLPGDKVCIRILEEKKGVIEQVLPRTSQLVRPPVANVEQVLVTFALRDPNLDLLLLDRLLIMVKYHQLEPIIVFNKVDLEDSLVSDNLLKIYHKAGYRVLKSSAYSGEGIETIGSILKNKISVFTGPSGAGKSSLLNAVQEGLRLKTGTLSSKISRGKHTTRHVELLELDFGGWVADTPGFSALEMPAVLREELDLYYPEIGVYRGSCRFTSCMHHHEPDCSVKEAVASGEIDPGRYERYLIFLQEVIEKERRY